MKPLSLDTKFIDHGHSNKKSGIDRVAGEVARRKSYPTGRNLEKGLGKRIVRTTDAKDNGGNASQVGQIGKRYPKRKGAFTRRSRGLL
jgi:hypothetical protein